MFPSWRGRTTGQRVAAMQACGEGAGLLVYTNTLYNDLVWPHPYNYAKAGIIYPATSSAARIPLGGIPLWVPHGCGAWEEQPGSKVAYAPFVTTYGANGGVTLTATYGLTCYGVNHSDSPDPKIWEWVPDACCYGTMGEPQGFASMIFNPPLGRHVGSPPIIDYMIYQYGRAIVTAHMPSVTRAAWEAAIAENAVLAPVRTLGDLYAAQYGPLLLAIFAAHPPQVRIDVSGPNIVATGYDETIAYGWVMRATHELYGPAGAPYSGTVTYHARAGYTYPRIWGVLQTPGYVNVQAFSGWVPDPNCANYGDNYTDEFPDCHDDAYVMIQPPARES